MIVKAKLTQPIIYDIYLGSLYQLIAIIKVLATIEMEIVCSNIGLIVT